MTILIYSLCILSLLLSAYTVITLVRLSRTSKASDARLTASIATFAAETALVAHRNDTECHCADALSLRPGYRCPAGHTY